jgi:hypothetical protein
LCPQFSTAQGRIQIWALIDHDFNDVQNQRPPWS